MRLIAVLTLVFVSCALVNGRGHRENGNQPHSHGAFRSIYTYPCRNGACTKIQIKDLQPGEKSAPLDVCRLNCGPGGGLWPLPTGKVELGQDTFNFYPQNVEFAPFQAEEPVKKLLKAGSDIFMSYLIKMHPDYTDKDNFRFPTYQHGSQAVPRNAKIIITLSVVWPESKVKIGNDESYTLAISTSDNKTTVNVAIMANTYFGVRHGLETLSQLIAYDEVLECLVIVGQALIADKPAYAYRGILMDTSRNFVSFPFLKRLIDALSYHKLNVFHWHITDTHSFPFESKRLPKMVQYGAYSPRKIYTTEQMKELVEYGRIRGVKVLPEFDAPAHVGHGWEWGPTENLGNLAVCVDKRPWDQYCVEPPCGQLNPVNQKMYDVLGLLYKDFLDIFDSDIFHMGGDEVNLNCWNTTDEITEWMATNGRGLSKDDFVELWANFQEEAYIRLKTANKEKDLDVILWTSELASKDHILQYLNNSKYIIQIWTNGKEEGHVIPYLIRNGYRTIFSQVDPWYLDCGYGAWVGNGTNNWCSPYKGWQQVYSNNPIKIIAETEGDEYANEAYNKGLILGGEAPLWSEQVDEQAMESKIWPRGSALAERLWTNPSALWLEAETRMLHNRQRIVARGVRADQLQPEWCHQNEDACVL